MKKLIEKRNALIAEFDAIKGKLEAEQRSAFDNSERERVNAIKIEIEDLDNQIAVEKDFEAKRNAKLDSIAINTRGNKEVNLVTEFRSFLNGESNESKFTVPFSYLKGIEQRAAITTSTNSQLNFTNQGGLSVANSELVLDKIGVPTFYFDAGQQDMPSMSQIVGSFGTEDSSVSDATLSTAKITLKPEFVSASLEVSKKFLHSSKAENIEALMSQLKYAIEMAVEKRTIDSMNSLTAAVATGASVTFHSGTTVMEGALLGAPTAYIFSRKGIQIAKNKKVGTDQTMVYKDGVVNGYPALRSSLQTQDNYAYLVQANALAKAYWGEGISVEIVTDSTLARKGSVLLIASANADGSYLDANKVAVAKNIHQWS